MALRGSLVTTGSVSLSGSVQAASTQFTGPVGFQDDANVTGSLAVQSTTMLSGALFLKTLGKLRRRPTETRFARISGKPLIKSGIQNTFKVAQKKCKLKTMWSKRYFAFMEGRMRANHRH